VPVAERDRRRWHQRAHPPPCWRQEWASRRAS
jgi:hypothetical protein